MAARVCLFLLSFSFLDARVIVLKRFDVFHTSTDEIETMCVCSATVNDDECIDR